MLGDRVGRVRVLSDAVKDLAASIREATSEWKRHSGQVIIDDRSRGLISQGVTAMHELTRQLAVTNQNLGRLAQTPLLGALGGGAEREIENLRASVDLLNTALTNAMQAGLPLGTPP